MRRSARHTYQQAYNAQAIVDADGSQLVPGTDVYAIMNDRHGLAGLVDHLCETIGAPVSLLGASHPVGG